MTILADNILTEVEATAVSFQNDLLEVTLSDGRLIAIPFHTIPWLRWLANATPAQRNNWHIEPGGFAIYWDELDDGIEIAHLLGMQPLV